MKTLFVLVLLAVILADLNTLIAQSKPIEVVEFMGYKRTDLEFLQRFVSVKKGQPLDSLLLLRETEQLKRLPSIAHAEFSVVQTPLGGHKVTFQLEENSTLIPTLSVFTSSDDNVSFRVGLAQFNSFGKNIAIGATYQYSNYHSFTLDFQAPYLLSNKLGLGLGYRSNTTLEPIYFNDRRFNFRYSLSGVEGSLFYNINYNNALKFGAFVFKEDYRFLGDAQLEEVAERLKAKKLQLNGLYTYDALRFNYYRLSGFKNEFRVQHVFSESEELPSFYYFQNDFFYFKQIGSRGNLASRLRLALSKNIPRSFAPFSLDNNVNIRGVGNIVNRGTGSVVLNTEYRHTLIEKNWFALQGNVFLDAGSWRDSGKDFSSFSSSKNIRVHPGLGFRLIHKYILNAVFRIDYGFGITKNRERGLVFGIRQYF